MFKLIFLENEASSEKHVVALLRLFFHLESSVDRLYHNFEDTLYMYFHVH